MSDGPRADSRTRGTLRILRCTLTVLLLAVAVLAGLVGVAGWSFSTPGYEGPLTAHFDGKHFHNLGPPHERTFADLLKWLLSRDRTPWCPVEGAAPGPPSPLRVSEGVVSLTFVNHSTVLLQLDGWNILADPIWSARSSPVSWSGPKRVRPPGIRFEDLPEIDLVLVSHNHYDHLDLPTLRRLDSEHGPLILTGLGNARYLSGEGISAARDLDWWEETELRDDLRVTFVPAQHFSGRGLFDRNATLWGGFVIEAPSARVYIAGDIGFGPHFAEIRDRLGAPDLALLPIGAFEPRWFMGTAHLSPREAVETHGMLSATRSIAIHFGTFPLADDAQGEAECLLCEAREELKVSPEAFWLLTPGDARELRRSRP
ncbi:MAG: MBL fold metallo-hydrolase [Planctomycetota bacterium]